MPKQLYVVSTASSSVTYAKYSEAPKGAIPRVLASVTIKGGAGVADKRFETLTGYRTPITEAEKDILMSDPTFRDIHLKNGFMQITEHDVDAETFAADMAARDGGSPAVPSDFQADADGNGGAPVVVDTGRANNRRR